MNGGRAIRIPAWDGLEQGTIAERATPGAGVLFAGTVRPWVAGARVADLANGNSADAPAAPTVNPRVDILLDNNTWVSGAEAAEPVFPTPTAGRAWLCAVFRKVGDVNDIRTIDNGTNAFIYGRNLIGGAIFQRRRGSASSTTSGVAVDLPDTLMPCYMDRAGVFHALVQADTGNSSSANNAVRLEVDDVTFDSADEAYGVDGIPANLRGSPTAISFRNHAAGALKVQGRYLTSGGTVDVSYKYIEVRIPR